MGRIRIPDPGRWLYGPPEIYEKHGTRVSFLWYWTEAARRTIETQYKTPEELVTTLGISRATAYRLIAAQPKRYWCTDLRDEENPRVYAVVPTSVMENYVPRPVGNPNLHSGLYQQALARRQRKKSR